MNIEPRLARAGYETRVAARAVRPFRLGHDATVLAPMSDMENWSRVNEMPTWLLPAPEVAVEGGAEVVEVVEAEPCLQLLIPRETPNREPHTHTYRPLKPSARHTSYDKDRQSRSSCSMLLMCMNAVPRLASQCARPRRPC